MRTALTACILLVALVAVPNAWAAPSFTDFSTLVGGTGQDNNYAVYSRDNLIVATHSVTTSGITVVEVSQDYGATWSQVSTLTQFGGDVRIAARSAQNIVLVSCVTYEALRTTDGGSTWTKANVRTNAAGATLGTLATRGGCDMKLLDDRYVFAGYYCTSTTGTGGACRSTGSSGIDHDFFLISYFSADGVTWSPTTQLNIMSMDAGTSTQNVDMVSCTGVDRGHPEIQMVSSFEWKVYYAWPYHFNGADYAPGGGYVNTYCQLSVSHTVNTGASFNHQPINDNVNPLRSHMGQHPKATLDGDRVFYLVSGQLWQARRVTTTFPMQWSTQAVADVVAVQQFQDARAYACDTKDVLVFQGPNGSDRISYAEFAIGGNSPVISGVTGEPGTGANAFGVWKKDNAFYFMFEDTGTSRLKFRQTGSGECVRTADNANPTGGTATASVDPFFCSEDNNEEFGYNYEEGVVKTHHGDITSSGMANPLFIFNGDASNFAYLAKTFTPTHGARVHFRIEAHTENVESVFRAVFSFANHDPWDPDYGNPDPEATHILTSSAKGNGKTTAAFASAIEVRFWERGNDWNMQIFKMTGGKRVEVGPAYVGDNPNSATSYSLAVDTRAGFNFVHVKRTDGSSIGNGPLERALPAEFAGLPIRGQWFVGYGADTAFNNDATTYLDGRDSATSSTCIYDITGTTTIAQGDQGASGPASNPTTGQVYDTIDNSNPDNQPPPVAPKARTTIFDGYGLSKDNQYLFGLALMGAVLVVGKRRFDMEAETIKAVCLVLWVAFVWMGLWPAWTLIAAGAIAVAMFGKGITKAFGG